ncbi:MAG: ATP-binding protein [Hydrococcus sp. Prado102]|jgi:DNA gyrase subunit B|nr:ATP-binding protein [Hydrococcus sp. Prado102]
MTDSGDRIEVLQGLEPIRKRPGMYIGSTGSRGLHCLVDEVIDNAIEEFLAGYCTRIEVILNPDESVTVIDNGRGIPTDIHPLTKKSFLETVLTTLRACGRCGSGDSYKVAGGLHGVGIVVVNALSEWLEVTVWRDGNRYTQRYEKGNVVTELQIQTSQENRTGTAFTFKPDREIFRQDAELDRIPLAIRLQELAYLCPNLEIILRDRRFSQEAVETYCYPGGIQDYIDQINRDRHPLHEDVIYIRGERDKVQVEVALQWCVENELEHLRFCFPCAALIGQQLQIVTFQREQQVYDTIHFLSFANLVRTIDGGTHVAGVKNALTQILTQINHQKNLLPDNTQLNWQQIRNGLTGIVSVKLFEPEYKGSCKWELANPEVQDIVEFIVEDGLSPIGNQLIKVESRKSKVQSRDAFMRAYETKFKVQK